MLFLLLVLIDEDKRVNELGVLDREYSRVI
jgi:hypothetical protein